MPRRISNKYQAGYWQGVGDGRRIRSAPVATWKRAEVPVPRDVDEREDYLAGYIAGLRFAQAELRPKGTAS